MEPIQFSFLVAPEDSGRRLDAYLAARAELVELAVSRSRIKQLIEDGQVTLDGRALADPAVKVASGAAIGLTLPPARPAEPQGQAIKLDIVHEDEDLIVLNKPAGLVVHPAAGHADGTLVNALIAHCGDSLSGIGGVLRPGIVHRLDKDTSGLMVAAKNDATHRGLSALFADHGRTMDFERDYLAIVWGAPDRKAGTVEAALARHSSARDKMAVTRGAQGKEAITHWALEQLLPDAQAPQAALLRCSLETGRTHQIRVHMAHIGHPLIGDGVYGAGFKTKAARLPPKAREAVEKFPRQALHAVRLAFCHPRTGKFLDFSREPPADFMRLQNALGATQHASKLKSAKKSG